MHEEVAAAVNYLVELAAQVSPSTFSWTAQAKQTFQLSLKASLEARYSDSWHPIEPERGSAARALLWNPSVPEDGLDEAISSAFQAVLQICKDGAKGLTPERLLSRPLTLWIDPGCVTVRREDRSNSSQPGSTQVIWGAAPAPAPSPRSTLPARALPPTLVLSSETDRRPSNELPAPFFPQSMQRLSIVDTWASSRSRSNSSDSSSGNLHEANLLRSFSDNSSSSGTASSQGHSSLYNDSLRSFMHRGASSATASSYFSSNCSSSEDEDAASSLCGDSEISADDEQELIQCANTLGLLNFLGDDSMEQPGDETVMGNETQTPHMSPFKLAAAEVLRPRAPAPPAPSILPASEPLEEKKRDSVQLYDKGNVTVMSGGVKLGTAKSIKKQPSTSSLSTSSHSSAAASSMSRGASAPSQSPRYPSLPLPYGMQQQDSRTTSAFYRATAAAFSSTDSLSSSGAESSQPGENDWQSAQEQLEQQARKARTRGRRSRGRGAGRALRRQQAAAVRALAAAEFELQFRQHSDPAVAAAAMIYGVHSRSGSMASSIGSQSAYSASNINHPPSSSVSSFELQLEDLARQHLQMQQHRVSQHPSIYPAGNGNSGGAYPPHALASNNYAYQQQHPYQHDMSLPSQSHQYQPRPSISSTSRCLQQVQMHHPQREVSGPPYAPFAMGHQPHFFGEQLKQHQQQEFQPGHSKSGSMSQTPRPNAVQTF